MGDRTKANRLSWPPRIERGAASVTRSRHSHNGIAGEAAQKMAGTHGTGRKGCTPAEAIDVVAGVHGCKGAAASTMRLWTGLRGVARLNATQLIRLITIGPGQKKARTSRTRLWRSRNGRPVLPPAPPLLRLWSRAASPDHVYIIVTAPARRGLFSRAAPPRASAGTRPLRDVRIYRMAASDCWAVADAPR
jgi:hypothetical protein